jgi:hypothetical protein
MTFDEICRRAGGRRHYNAWRGTLRLQRRCKVSRLLRTYPLFKRGTVTAIAEVLGVSVATISRDIQAILRVARPCHCCGAPPIIGPDPAEDELADMDG